MFFYEGQICPVCGQHFAETDDIVTCPECGCPHHRECWKKEGHCHFADDHGTERQWAQGSAAEARQEPSTPQSTCPHCGGKNPEFAEFCAHCGKDIEQEDWESELDDDTPPPPVGQYTPPFGSANPPFGGFNQPFQMPLHDPYGGVSRTEDIDGVPVDQIAELIGSNSAYYLPQFYRMTHGGSKISWNWAAFLLPANWLLYRKNLVWGIVITLVQTVIEFFLSFGTLPLFTADPSGRVLTLQPLEKLLADPHSRMLLLLAFVALMSMLIIRILFGMLGNYLYLQAILKKAKRQQKNPELRYDRSFLKTGGTSFALAIIPTMLPLIVEYVQLIVTALL